MYYAVTLAAYAVGVSGTADPQPGSAFAAIAGVTVGYQAINIPWTTDKTVLDSERLEIQQIIGAGRQPVIIYDPVLPRTFDDSLFAIYSGLAAEYYFKFFNIIKGIQADNPNFRPIIVIGSSINGEQTYSSNATQFKEIFEELVIYCKTTMGIQAYFAFSINPTFCGPVTEVVAPEPSSYVLNEAENDYSRLLNCSKNFREFYPGDSFVDWIQVVAVNENNVQLAVDIVNKGMVMADQTSKSKPIMLVIGSKSPDESTQTAFKNAFLLEVKELAENYSETNKFYHQRVRALIFENTEKNKDVAFYDSIKGDITSSTTQNGVSLYYYKNLRNLFKGSSAVSAFNLSILAIGSICGVGEYGAIEFSDCKPCETGSYNNATGEESCTPCEIGYYQDDPGQAFCKRCPDESTTQHNGTEREEYCVCIENMFKGSNNDCEPCPRNYYSPVGGQCTKCPEDNTYKGNNGKAGEGCFCLKGSYWDSQTATCVKGTKDGLSGRRLRTALISLTLAGALVFM